MANVDQVLRRFSRTARRFCTMALLATFGAAAAFAQGRIQGIVTDSNTGETLPGANILLVELPTRGTTSAGDGSYLITSVPAGTYTLRASYLGYASVERQVIVPNGLVTVNIAMVEGDVSLEDFVVTGYGVEIRREVTGASSSVRGEEFQRVPVLSADNALQGRAAGVQITSVSGAPGAGVQIRVRGIGSINAGTTPLYIIDGVQVRSGALGTQAAGNLLNSLNPNDIESIEVLKDAAAVAIYGAQAANGVVLITTKRGVEGPTRLEITSSLGAIEPIRNLDVLTGPEYVRNALEADANYFNYINNPGANNLARKKLVLGAAGIPTATVNAITDDAGIEAAINAAPTTNWQDAVTQTGAMRRLNVSTSGGVRNTRFYLSGGAEYAEGQIIRSDFNRLSFRANLDHRPTRRFGIEANMGATSVGQFGTSDGGNFVNSPIFQPARQRPTDPIYNADGTYAAVKGNYNILEYVELEDKITRQMQVQGSLRATYQPITNLVLGAFAGTDVAMIRDRNFRPPEIPTSASTGGTGFEAAREALNYNISGTANYFKQIGKQNINLLVGTEYKREHQEQFSANARDYATGLLGTFQSAATATSVAGFQTEYRTASVFSQAKYDFNNKYFVTGSLRYDGSSRFGENRKFGLFPSISGAWDIAREPFMQVGAIDELKLRGSYGITGNSAISDFASLALFGRGGSYLGAAGIRQSQLANINLGWERARQFDIALDYSLFDSRVAGSVDYFHKINEDLLLARPLVSDAAAPGNSINENIGSMMNRGVELELRTLNLARGGFEWRSDFNISFIRNEVRSLLEGQDTLQALGLFVGKPRDVYYTYQFAGINPADGRPMYYDRNGQITYQPVAADQQVVADIVPDHFGGFTNTFSFRGLSLSAFLQYNYGQDAFLQQQGYFLWDPSRLDNMERIAVENAWRQPGDFTEYPQLLTQTNTPGASAYYTTPSTRLIDDASYVRLKTVTLAYALPRSLLRYVRTRNAQVYATGTNLATWTNFRGFDPEVVGTAAANYPQSRSYTVGMSLTF